MFETRQHSILRRGITLDNGKQILATSAIDAEPNRIVRMPEDLIMPFILSVLLLGFFSALLVNVWIAATIFGFLSIPYIVYWLWPTGPNAELQRQEEASA